MAHSCPDCGDTCYCRGDMDDMLMDGGPEEQGCVHGCDPERDFDWNDADEIAEAE